MLLASLAILLGVQQGALAQTAGASAFLVGTWDIRQNLTTLLQIVNPTRQSLRLFIAFFDGNEHFLKCIKSDLSENGLFEIDASQVVPAGSLFGVVKVLTLLPPPAVGPPWIGVIGNQRLSLRGEPVAETGLHPVPPDRAEQELIVGSCG
jgi:hypothetical protein